ncbi:ATP-binding protein [Streptosporangium sp. NPDC006007]|uniref:ATP-binding protein n=1 Tax=Streptosporangium sp. NPDC006007 TaxID=3154575 RepID=UPI0033AB61C0
MPPALTDVTVRLFPGGVICRRTFPGRSDQIPRVRRFIRFLLEDSPCRDDAEQVVAELAANAITHTGSGRFNGTFTVKLTRRAGGVRITVYDRGGGATPRFDSRGDTDPFAEHGRGLALVAALASRVGCRGTRATGHAVWAELSPM